jgi:hypothetical protein
VLDQKKGEVESLIKGVAGAVGYDLVRTSDGGVSVTVCENTASADETVKIAAEWIKNNSSTGASAPRISEGESIVHF